MGHATTAIPRALARAMREEIDALATELARARKGEAAGVHRARVASRRLREHLPIVAGTSGDDRRDLERELRRVTRALGGVREMDVARDLLRQFAEDRAWRPAVVARVDRSCARLRRQREKLLRAEVPASLVDVLPARLREWVERSSSRPHRTTHRAIAGPASSAPVLARLKDRAGELATALDNAGTLYAAEPLHHVRIATKKLRYVLELTRPAAGVSAGREARIAKEAQARLGEIHDLQVLQARVQAVASESKVDPATARQLTELDRELETACRERHARFLPAVARLRQLAERAPADFALRVVARRRARMARMTASSVPPVAAKRTGSR